jgi:hypothetical protein
MELKIYEWRSPRDLVKAFKYLSFRVTPVTCVYLIKRRKKERRAVTEVRFWLGELFQQDKSIAFVIYNFP